MATVMKLRPKQED